MTAKKPAIISAKNQMAAMMNMKLKHVLFLSISFCCFVYFVDRHFSSSSSDGLMDGVSEDNIEIDQSSSSSSSSSEHSQNTSDINASKNSANHKLASSDEASHPVVVDDPLRIPEMAKTGSDWNDRESELVVNVVMVLKDAATNTNLQRKFDITVASIFKHSR